MRTCNSQVTVASQRLASVRVQYQYRLCFCHWRFWIQSPSATGCHWRRSRRHNDQPCAKRSEQLYDGYYSWSKRGQHWRVLPANAPPVLFLVTTQTTTRPRASNSRRQVRAGAGDGLKLPAGVWASISGTRLSNNFATTSFDSDLTAFAGGVDWFWGDQLLVGMAFGLES